ncbi:hypothetical protein F3Y22_tig00117048pilonHSYRG01391 [Hibiscus syriacus]|uniref:RING-type E3 ubiquitin transferase n=1 Tax=Hibiscus syriacus TaxID=106335 RepID=A0A6A2XL89_HIBSY|nr:hypothetical protein F3Y22_tig00117048pilonHSYRG01391 [Hibiscus syriacus]
MIGLWSYSNNYVIAMYSPRSFSIKQRSSLFGAISNVKKDIALDNPLYFGAMKGIGLRDITKCLPYNYSKINLVNAFESRTPPYQILNIVKLWLFQYPALKDAEEPLAQLSHLTNNLALDGYVVPDDHPIARPKSRVLIQLELLTLGPLSGWFNPICEREISERNLSLQKISQAAGEMHLIACMKALVASIGLERGQDCLISVKIQYTPRNLQRWQKPIAKITISSQRKEDDPLYFSLIIIHACLNNYPDYFEAIAGRAFLEAVAGIVLLTVSIAFIRNQFSYKKVNEDIVPYISTTMLSFQFLGYSLPLICGTKVVLKTMEPEAYNTVPRQHHADSRSKTISQRSSTQRCGSREKMIMLITMAIYVFGFLIWCVAGYNPDVQIISNGLMAMPGKSLKQAYYLGLTSVRLVMIFFDHVMDPITRAKVDVFYVDSSSNSTHLTLTIVLGPLTMIMCAIRVYIQQNWKHQKHS